MSRARGVAHNSAKLRISARALGPQVEFSSPCKLLCLTNLSDSSHSTHPSDTSYILFISHSIITKLDIQHLVLYLNMIRVCFE